MNSPVLLSHRTHKRLYCSPELEGALEDPNALSISIVLKCPYSLSITYNSKELVSHKVCIENLLRLYLQGTFLSISVLVLFQNYSQFEKLHVKHTRITEWNICTGFIHSLYSFTTVIGVFKQSLKHMQNQNTDQEWSLEFLTQKEQHWCNRLYWWDYSCGVKMDLKWISPLCLCSKMPKFEVIRFLFDLTCNFV